MNAKKFLLIIFIFSLPYNNFPYGVGGTLTPLSLMPGAVFILLSFFKFCLRGILKINRSLVILSVVFLYFVVVTIFNDIRFYEYFINQKIISPWFRTFQFIIYSFISLIAFYIGYKSLDYLNPLNKILRFILYAYIPSIIFGILEIITDNHHILNLIRGFFASTRFPDGYYRIYLLTTEPSWAGFDIVTFVIPITLYLFSIYGNRVYLLLLLIELLILIEIKSMLGIIVFVSLLFVYLFFSISYKRRIIPLIISSLMIVIFLSSLYFFKDAYLERFQKFLEGGDSSALTRTVTYIIATKVFINEPIMGVGFRNSGYFYSEYIDPLLLTYPLIRDWADFWSKRFPDIKSTIFEILASMGVQGIIFVVIFLFFIAKKIWTLKDEDLSLLFLMIFIASLIGSFSLNLIGYPIFWFLIGLLQKLSKRYY